jgi:hypothetical protein
MDSISCAPALQVFLCVGAWMCSHTPGKYMSLVRTAGATPFRLPCPPSRPPSVSDSWQKSCPQLSNRPHKLRPCFQVPTDSQGLWGVHEQYLSDPWEPGHAVMCVWKPERRSFTHSRYHARSLKVRFFRNQLESSRPYMWGVGLTQQIA